jgi:hypothetical protein
MYPGRSSTYRRGKSVQTIGATAQGGVSAQMPRKYEPFRVKMLETVKQHYGVTKANELEEAVGARWTVELQIADFRDPMALITFHSLVS